MVRAAEAVTDLPSLLARSSAAARDPVTQRRIADASWKLLLLFGLGVLAEWAAAGAAPAAGAAGRRRPAARCAAGRGCAGCRRCWAG
ncbi:hypothetical protein ACFFMP_08080 [Pseudoroseomonas cervicalis]|uniref:hypothetical protein n=1 Tax=Teichococcus cervicalis TaxID=204525 RepID=UPI0035ED6407